MYNRPLKSIIISQINFTEHEKSSKSKNKQHMCQQSIKFNTSISQEIPIVIAGNKSDLANTHREVGLDEVTDWLYCEIPKIR